MINFLILRILMSYRSEKNQSQNEEVYITHTTTTQPTTTTLTTVQTTAPTRDRFLNKSLEPLESRSRRQNLNISDTSDYFKQYSHSFKPYYGENNNDEITMIPIICC